MEYKKFNLKDDEITQEETDLTVDPDKEFPKEKG